MVDLEENKKRDRLSDKLLPATRIRFLAWMKHTGGE
jgi:hypothetical protein